MTYQTLRKRIMSDPERYSFSGWSVGYEYPRWSDRPAGEKAFVVFTDHDAQKTIHVWTTPKRGMALGAPDPD